MAAAKSAQASKTAKSSPPPKAASAAKSAKTAQKAAPKSAAKASVASKTAPKPPAPKPAASKAPASAAKAPASAAKTPPRPEARPEARLASTPPAPTPASPAAPAPSTSSTSSAQSAPSTPSSASAPSISRVTPPAGMPPGVPAGPARPATGTASTAPRPLTPRPAGLSATPAAPVRPARPGSPGSSVGSAGPTARSSLTARPAAPRPVPPPAPAVPSVRLGTRVGTGKWSYEPIPDWGRSAAGGGVAEFGTVSGIACDSKDNVYVFQRTIEPCVLVFTPDGQLLRKFGGDTFRNPHGIWIGRDATRGGEEVALLTDRDLHQVVKYTLEGRKLATWGAAYREPGDAGQPFNQPARATLGPRGEMYVADGYGQYRVHQFSPEGELVHSWGKRGKGPGEFGWPVHHALLDPRGRLIVSDRGNNRLQLFSPRGKYQGEWADLDMPQDYVISRGGTDGELMLCEGNAKRIAVLDLDGNVLARWGEGGSRPGQFAASPHSIWVDSRGDLYVGEVVDPNRLTKFVRR